MAHINRRAFLKIAVLGAGAALFPAAIWERAAYPQAAVGSLDGLLEPIRAAHGMPALAGAFVRGRDLAALGAVGVRRAGTADRVEAHDRFHIGSCTKSMTATLVAMLVEQGKLSWQTTVAEIFPDLLGRIHSAYHRVTVTQLLSHRSGLPDDRAPDPAIWPLVRGLGGPTQEQRRALAEIVLSRAPAAPPGSQFLYSNLGYAIAGAFAEKVTGQSWEDLMRQMLFGPLGMPAAGFGAPGGAAPWGHAPPGCSPVAPGPDADNPSVIGPAGTVNCSMSDWARYAALHLRGAQGAPGLLVGPESFRRLHRDEFRQGYALGWVVVERDWAGGTALMHTGTNTLWYAVIWLAPARDAGFLAATNCGPESGFRACDAAVGAMIRRYLL